MDQDYQGSPTVEPALCRFPPEILAECFLFSGGEHLPTYHPYKSPVNLTAVSRSWRAVALSTPRLWARFRFVFLCVDEEHASEERSKLALCLQRSKPMPLTYMLALQLRHYSTITTAHGLFPRALKLLEKHAYRWHDIIVQNCSIDHLMLQPASHPVTSFPLLKRLSPFMTSISATGARPFQD